MPAGSTALLAELIAALRRNGIEYIVVGGQAIAEEIPVTTQDLDVMVALRNFDRAVAQLGREPAFGTEERKSWIARWEVDGGGATPVKTDVDLLNGQPYCGTMSPDDFFDYIRERWTVSGKLGLTARPPVVWYTRLLAVGFWGAYALKVMRDIRAGAPRTWFDGVREIAERTGTSSMIAERIAYVEDALRPDP
jgi:hypothetical protein